MTDEQTEVPRVAVTFSGPKTMGAIYIPRYEVPVVRAWVKKRWGDSAARSFKISNTIPEGVGPAEIGNPYSEMNRIQKLRGHAAVSAVYPTDESFFEALEAETDIAVDTEKRESLEIEKLSGIGAKTADTILKTTGSGTIEDLAKLDWSAIAGLSDQLTTASSKRFIELAQEHQEKNWTEDTEED